MPTIDDVLAKLQSEIGDKIVDQPKGKTVSGITTGSLALDLALDTGGWPIGYGTQLVGKKGGGKTTLCVASCVKAAANGQRAIYFDLEHKTLPELFHGCGLPEDQLIWLRTDTESVATKVLDALHKVDGPLVILTRLYSGTLALDVLKYALLNSMMQLAIVDSVAGITSTVEHDKKSQDQTVAMTARIMSNYLRPLAAPLGLSECAVVWVNQIREQISTGPYRLPQTSPGGHAMKFWSAIIANIRAISRGKDGQTSLVKIKETCLSKPQGKAEIDIIYGKGIDYTRDVFEAAAKLGVISTAGGWCKFGDLALGDDRGKDNSLEWLRSQPELVERIREAAICKSG